MGSEGSITLIDDQQTTTSRADRRTFLSLGLGCAVPVLVGGRVLDATGTLAAWKRPASADPVMDHVSRELMRAYNEMRGPTGIRGEHVRTLAASLDLLGAHLEARGDDRRLDAVLRRRIRENGREGTVQELSARYADLAVGLSLQHGVVSRVETDDQRSLAALDSLVTHGVAGRLHGSNSGLRQLAANIDRAKAVQHAKPVAVVLRQKPGDDFLGYPAPEGHMTWCTFLAAMANGMAMIAAILGATGLVPAAAEVGIAAAALQVLQDALCQLADAP